MELPQRFLMQSRRFASIYPRLQNRFRILTDESRRLGCSRDVHGKKSAQNGPKPPSLRHQNPLSERQTQNQTKSWKLGTHKIQWNKKGRRTVSPILQNRHGNNSGEVGPLKSAEKQAKMGQKKNGLFGAVFGGLRPSDPRRSKNAKKRKKSTQNLQILSS